MLLVGYDRELMNTSSDDEVGESGFLSDSSKILHPFMATTDIHASGLESTLQNLASRHYKEDAVHAYSTRQKIYNLCSRYSNRLSNSCAVRTGNINIPPEPLLIWDL